VLHVALTQRTMEYVFTLPPALFLLHATHGLEPRTLACACWLERILPHGIFRKETPTQPV
jgi:hypothetical protein